jgi:hypothetical protein
VRVGGGRRESGRERKGRRGEEGGRRREGQHTVVSVTIITYFMPSDELIPTKRWPGSERKSNMFLEISLKIQNSKRTKNSEICHISFRNH